MRTSLRQIVAVTLLALFWTAAAFAQQPEPSPAGSWAALAKATVRDPASYAPAIVKYGAMHLDWESSQIFFQHGYVERNARYTVSGRSGDVPISHAAGSRKIVGDSLMVLTQSVPANFTGRVVERYLARRFPGHRRFWAVAGQTARLATSTYISYTASATHFTQWRKNEQLAGAMGFK